MKSDKEETINGMKILLSVLSVCVRNSCLRACTCMYGGIQHKLSVATSYRCQGFIQDFEFGGNPWGAPHY